MATSRVGLELAGVRLVDVPEFQILQVPVAAPSKA